MSQKEKEDLKGKDKDKDKRDEIPDADLDKVAGGVSFAKVLGQPKLKGPIKIKGKGFASILG